MKLINYYMTNLRKTIITSTDKIKKYKNIFLFLCISAFLLFLFFKIDSLQTELIKQLKENSEKKVVVEIDKRNIEESYKKIFDTLEEYKKQININAEVYIKSIKKLETELNNREKEVIEILKSKKNDGDVFKKFENVTNIKEYK